MCVLAMTDVVRVVKRRQQRRRSVGKAYDTAIEVADLIPPDTRLLDVGCGNGFVAHHLNALLGTRVTGVDVGVDAKARIKYLRYDGTRLPVRDGSYDGVLLSYVLHHVQDVDLVLSEVCRVLRKDGLVVVYEDVPKNLWDRVPCWTHDRMWRRRTGPCTFRRPPEWADLFASYGLEIVSAKSISRWRNVFYPIGHILYVLKATGEPIAFARYGERVINGN
jgi:ubiquinone/menaquinone biosynthesis C-methylase UbiE